MNIWQDFVRQDYDGVLRILINNNSPIPGLENRESQRAKLSFSSFKEYLCTLGLCAKIEQEISERYQGYQFNTIIRILEPQDDISKLAGLLKIPETIRDEISAGDKAYLNFRVGRSFEKKSWTLQFIEPFPCSPPGLMTATLTRPNRENDKEYTPQTIPWPDAQTPANVIPHIMKGKGNECQVVIVPGHSIFPYVFQALDILWKTTAIGNPLGAVELRREPKYDIYSTIEDMDCISKKNFDLNDSQMAAVQRGRVAPAGVVIAHGGPGTGKTQ